MDSGANGAMVMVDFVLSMNKRLGSISIGTAAGDVINRRAKDHLKFGGPTGKQST